MQCKNVKECACPKTACVNHGRCCACVVKHKTTDSLPFCLFPDNGGDKSNQNHYEVLKKKYGGERSCNGARDLSAQSFFDALISGERSAALPGEFDYFGKLIGGWSIKYVDNAGSRSYRGEWHFARTLQGMAVQDVIILPGLEYGTTLRLYNPDTRAWDVAYCYTGKIMWLQAKKEDGMIVLTHLADEKRKWIFAAIEDNRFHWQDVTVTDDGRRRVDFDLYAERKNGS